MKFTFSVGAQLEEYFPRAIVRDFSFTTQTPDRVVCGGQGEPGTRLTPYEEQKIKKRNVPPNVAEELERHVPVDGVLHTDGFVYFYCPPGKAKYTNRDAVWWRSFNFGPQVRRLVEGGSSLKRYVDELMENRGKEVPTENLWPKWRRSRVIVSPIPGTPYEEDSGNSFHIPEDGRLILEIGLTSHEFNRFSFTYNLLDRDSGAVRPLIEKIGSLTIDGVAHYK